MEKQAEQEVKILNNGLAMPLLGIGTFNGFRDDKPITISQAVCQAIKIGYRHIDCAYAYNNETEIGAAIKPWVLEIMRTQYSFLSNSENR